MSFEERMQILSKLVEKWCPDEHKRYPFAHRLIYAFLNLTAHLEEGRGELTKKDSDPIFIS